jgi:uncharacterized membrane protein YccC
MGMPQQVEERKVTVLDIRMGVAVFICFMVSTICSKVGFLFPAGDRNLEIIQKMTSCIACLLCCQDTTAISLKAGINRIIITFIGGLVGILVIILDDVIGNDWILGCMVALGIVLTLYLCKAAKVPYINARIGGVTFILVTCTLQSGARIYYGIFRLISTVFGVLVVLFVTWVFQLLSRKK